MILKASFELNDATMWENRGLFYGDGVFETMRSLGTDIPLWDLHYERLQHSLKWLQIKPPEKVSLFQILIESLNVKNSLVLRLTLFRQQTKRGYQATDNGCHWLLTGSEFQSRSQPQHLVIADQQLSAQPLLKGHKHLNRLPQVLIADQLNQQPHADDLLVLDDEQRVIETTCQNLLLVKDGQLITPNLHNSGVAGVALNWLGRQRSMAVKTVRLNELKSADVVMTCNAVHGFRYVESIEGVGEFSIKHSICDKIAGMWRVQFLQSSSP